MGTALNLLPLKRAEAAVVPVLDTLEQNVILNQNNLDSLLQNRDSLHLNHSFSLFDGDSLQATTPPIFDTIPSDSLALMDTIAVDTLVKEEKKPFLDAPIFLSFKDSLIYEPLTKDIFIHQQGDVKYEQNQLQADYMQLNTETKLVHAVGVYDSVATKELGDTIQIALTRVNFKDGGTDYEMDSIYYNMDTGKALIYGVKSQDGEGIMSGGVVKKMSDNVVHMHGGMYTTCDADCPHFYLQMTKGTVVPGKQTVFGPAYLVFEGVPLYPLTVPFGFFPQTSGQQSGLIIPEIGEETVKGFFVRNGGYYFAINDYLDFKLLGSIYTLGSWDVSASSSYKVRYKYSGSFNVTYSDDVIGEPTSEDYIKSTGFSIKWSHQQDSKFNPSSTFSASVNFQSNASYNKYNASNMSEYLSSQTSSSIAYSKSWSGTPFSFSINASHTQNNTDSTITLGLPTMVFNVSRFTPFKRKVSVGAEKWYEKISMTYTMNMQNSVSSIPESELFQQSMWDKLRTGVKHTVPISASFNIGGVFTVTPNLNYNERWYFKKTEQTWDAESESILKDTVNGFYRVYDYSAGVSMNTKIYGTYKLGTKNPIIFRHVISPTLSASYAPNFGDEQYGFWKTVQSSAAGAVTKYSPFSDGVYGTAPNSQTGSLSFSLGNTLEAKVPSDLDTSGYKKISIIESLSLSGSYNFLADSMKLSTIGFSLRVPIVSNYTLNLSGTLDPYCLDADGNRYDRFLVQDGGFVRLSSLSFSAGYGFKSKASSSNASQKRGGVPAVNDPENNNNGTNFNNQLQGDFFAQKAVEEGVLSKQDVASLAAAQYYDFSIPWSLNLNYTFSYSNYTGTPSLLQTINASGSVNLTNKWSMSASLGYDLEMQTITPGTIQITRDLHCFQMSFSWVPVGFRQSWSFTIQAKSSMLSDVLKWDKNNSFLDNYYY